MLKIYPKIFKPNVKARFKNTVSANYRRNRLSAEVSSLLTFAEITRFPSWGVHDIGITAMLGTIAIKSISNTFKAMKALKPIKARAKAIRNIAKQNLITNA